MLKIILIILLFQSSFGKELRVKKIENINLGEVLLKKDTIKVSPKNGFLIEVKGQKNKQIKILTDLRKINQRDFPIKLVKVQYENEIITLSRNGKGVFRVGGIFNISNRANKQKKVLVPVEFTICYLDDTKCLKGI